MSSPSISESISDSSASSSGGDDSAALREDLRSYTALYARTGGEIDAYLRGVGELCARHSLVNWQESPEVPAVYVAA